MTTTETPDKPTCAHCGGDVPPIDYWCGKCAKIDNTSLVHEHCSHGLLKEPQPRPPEATRSLEFEKRYLGNSVYAEIELGQVKLTTDNGMGPSNTIYMEPEICEGLAKYVEDMKTLAGEHRERCRQEDWAKEADDGDEIKEESVPPTAP